MELVQKEDDEDSDSLEDGPEGTKSAREENLTDEDIIRFYEGADPAEDDAAEEEAEASEEEAETKPIFFSGALFGIAIPHAS